MNNSIILKSKLQDGRAKVLNRKYKCLAKDCNENAIGSHILQRRGIITNIVDQSNHFYSIEPKNIFNMSENNMFDIKKIGIKDGYKFPIFCEYHDNEIFKSIESDPIDFSNQNTFLLFSYRTLCLELRKKEIELELTKDRLRVHQELFPSKPNFVDFIPVELGILDLKFYKTEFEEDLKNKTNSKFENTLIELPQKKICFSTALTIKDKKNEKTFEYDKYGYAITTPLVTSILNYFPYKSKSFLIITFHRDYKCNWTKELIKNIQNQNRTNKIISDLLTYRLELWGIHPEFLKNSLKKGLKNSKKNRTFIGITTNIKLSLILTYSINSI